jgi:hypothetical protein
MQFTMQARGRPDDAITVHKNTMFFNWEFLATQEKSLCGATMHDVMIERIGGYVRSKWAELALSVSELEWLQSCGGWQLSTSLARGLAIRSNLYWRFWPFRPILPPEPPDVLAAPVND